MKRILSLALSVVMVLSSVPMAYATEDWEQGTKVEYVAQNNENWTITVPAQLQPGKSGTVTLDGYWPSNKTITVDADDTVTLKNSILQSDTKTLDITFNGISKIGNNTERTTASETVSVAPIQNALFGTWNGSFYYNVETSEQSGGGCNTLYWDGNTENCTEVTDTYTGMKLYHVSDKVPTIEDCKNGMQFIAANGQESFEITYEELQDQLDVYGIIAAEVFAIVPEDNYVFDLYPENSFTFPKVGIWLVMESNNWYVETLTIPGYTGFEHFDGCPHDTISPAGGCDTIYYDDILALGYEQGMLQDTEDGPMGYVKISDEEFTEQKLLDNLIITYKHYETEEIGIADISSHYEETDGVRMIALGEAGDSFGVGMYLMDTLEVEGVVYTPGLYIACMGIEYDHVTIAGYKGFEHTDKCTHIENTTTDVKFEEFYTTQIEDTENQTIRTIEYVFYEDGSVDIYDYTKPTGDNISFYGGTGGVLPVGTCKYNGDKIYLDGQLFATIKNNGNIIEAVDFTGQELHLELTEITPHEIYYDNDYTYEAYGGADCRATFDGNSITLYSAYDGHAWRTYDFVRDGHRITLSAQDEYIVLTGLIHPDGQKVVFAHTVCLLNN